MRGGLEIIIYDYNMKGRVENDENVDNVMLE